MRLTPEREKEIRSNVERQRTCAQPIEHLWRDQYDLLQEIDELREESEFRHNAAKAYAESCGIYRAEIDELKKLLRLRRTERQTIPPVENEAPSQEFVAPNHSRRILWDTLS